MAYLGERDTCPEALASGIVDVVVAFFRDRCLFENNGEALADLQADDDSDREVNEEVRSRRPALLRRLHVIDATRVHLTMKWLVSVSILRPFGLI